jgi:hypothetical protein
MLGYENWKIKPANVSGREKNDGEKKWRDDARKTWLRPHYVTHAAEISKSEITAGQAV